jgi:uncharacterized protein YjdB
MEVAGCRQLGTRLWLGGALLTGACSAGDSFSPPRITTVRIEPHQEMQLIPGESYRFSAVAADAGGSPVSGADFVWSSADVTVATVDASGLVTARAPGATRILAATGEVGDDAPLSVVVPVDRVSVAPTSSSITVGKTVQLSGRAEDGDGRQLTGPAISWQSSAPSVANVSASGLVTAVSPGTATIIASGGGKQASASVTVLAPVAGLHIAPTSIQLHPGDSLRLDATSFDPQGNSLPGRTMTWSTSDPQVARVSASGLLVATGVGTAFVIAEAEGQRDSVRLQVQASVRRVRVRPEQSTVRPGDTVQLEGTPQDAGGRALSGRELVWTSSNSSVATVSGSGIVTAVASGQATVTASSEGMAGRATITVQYPVATVTLSAEVDDLSIGEIVDLVATPRSAGGDVLTGREVTWSSDRADVASVRSSGRVTARAPGIATIVAQSEGVEGRATIHVSAAEGGGGGNGNDDGAVLVGAADIGSCIGDGDEATAKLLDRIPGTVFAAGDNVYKTGTAAEFANCYGPTWGRHKARTRPVAGNHEYETPGAAGYFGYFGAAAGDPDKGYYSYEVGAWHVVTLNSNLPAKAGTPQAQWLTADLDAHPTQCTVALWHHPSFSSDSGSTRMRDAWQILYDHGAEIVISGHHHNYERFAPQTATGVLDPSRGLRQFVVGTGGRSLGGKTGASPPNTEIRYTGGFGVLKLTLHADWYEWEFVSEAGKTFSDEGSARCH